MRMRWLPPLAYTVAVAPLVAASYGAAGVAFALYDRAPESVRRRDWMGHVLNEVAPALVGVGCAVLLVALLSRWQMFSTTLRGYFVRTLPWFLLAAAIGAVVLDNRANSDFGLWSQAITWPLAALLGGIATDALWTWRRAITPPAV